MNNLAWGVLIQMAEDTFGWPVAAFVLRFVIELWLG